MALAVANARRGWATKELIDNARSLDDLMASRKSDRR
jgi:hypothetical protein